MIILAQNTPKVFSQLSLIETTRNKPRRNKAVCRFNKVDDLHAIHDRFDQYQTITHISCAPAVAKGFQSS